MRATKIKTKTTENLKIDAHIDINHMRYTSDGYTTKKNKVERKNRYIHKHKRHKFYVIATQ